MIGIIQSVLEQGFIYSFVVMAVHLTSRVIRKDDLSVEGSFGLGGAVAAVALLHGVPPILTLVLAFIAGALAGMTTGLLHVKGKLNHLIAGLVLTIGLFSINLKLAGSNVSLMQHPTLFSGALQNVALLVLAPLAFAIFYLLHRLLRSEFGLLWYASGENPQLLLSLGKSVNGYIVLAFACANALTGFAGALFVQWTGFYSIMGNIGTLIIGLAGLIIGELFSYKFSLGLLAGAILYQALFAVTIELQIDPLWNNLIKAVLIVLLIQMRRRPQFQPAWR